MTSRGPSLRRGVTAVPDTHLDLLERPLVAALSTILPDGRPHTHPVWFSFAGRQVLVNTMRGFRKERNMRADPRVTLLVVDPGPNVHWVELRGRVELSEEWALEHLNELAWRYTGRRRYFGDVVPAKLAEREVPVIGRISSARVVTDVRAEAAVTRTLTAGGLRPLGLPPARRCCDVDRARIPPTHRDLLAGPFRACLSTLMPDGHPQTQPVWCDLDGDDVLVDTTCERQKGRNLMCDPRATVLVVDPVDSSRWIEIRGDADITCQDALEHLDRVTRIYTGHPHYYGWVLPLCRKDKEHRVLARIHPRRVVCDAIHG